MKHNTDIREFSETDETKNRHKRIYINWWKPIPAQEKILWTAETLHRHKRITIKRQK